MATAWDQPVPSTDPYAATGHDHGGGINEAATAATLDPLTGPAFDHEFLTILIAHHQAAIPYARNVVENGDNPDAKAIAQDVITVQTAEIASMQDLLSKLPAA